VRGSRGGRGGSGTSAEGALTLDRQGYAVALDVVTNFAPLYAAKGVSGQQPPYRAEGLLFELLTPGIPSSFACANHSFRVPAAGCAAPLMLPTVERVSVLQNFYIQRGLITNLELGFAGWLKNQTLALLCNASVDPFPSSSGNVSTGHRFYRYFSPVTGVPQDDMYGNTSTLAAGVVVALMYPDANLNLATPPVNHVVVFAVVVIELVLAFAVGACGDGSWGVGVDWVSCAFRAICWIVES
jgi:hypothetical protein